MSSIKLPTLPIYDLTAPTNGQAIRNGLIPCETDPDTGHLSRTTWPFHAVATYTTGSARGGFRHVCAGCLERHHKGLRVRSGIRWE